MTTGILSDSKRFSLGLGIHLGIGLGCIRLQLRELRELQLEPQVTFLVIQWKAPQHNQC